ncbi:MAG: hypothetical protein V4757_12705 [Pseudomonadota bacterium]
MIRLLVAAGLACLACSSQGQASNRYSWFPAGPFFRTPGEACIWARQFYDDIEPRTMSLGKDGFCRESGGTGYRYIKPYVSNDGAVDAASGRQALHGCTLEGLAGRERWSEACGELARWPASGPGASHAAGVAPAGTYRNVISLDEPVPASHRRHP